MKKLNDKIQELNNDDLDMVVGGVLNQNFIQQNNLKAFTGKSGAQGLRVRIHSNDPLVQVVMGHVTGHLKMHHQWAPQNAPPCVVDNLPFCL